MSGKERERKKHKMGKRKGEGKMSEGGKEV